MHLLLGLFRRIRLLAVAAPVVLAACAPRPEQPSAGGFERIAADGSAYAGSGAFAEEPWACVHDTRTGLIWEVRSPTPGPRYLAHTYSWYNADPSHNRGDAGAQNGGQCDDGCDTVSYTRTVNAMRLCGFDDWRMPSRDELATLNRRSRPGAPTMDMTYFPDGQSSEYWSGQAYTFHYSGAWAWNFDKGYDRVDYKSAAKSVRLVRDAAAPPVTAKADGCEQPQRPCGTGSGG